MLTTITRRCCPLAASLVALTLTAALAACGNDDDSSDSSETTSTAIAHPGNDSRDASRRSAALGPRPPRTGRAAAHGRRDQRAHQRRVPTATSCRPRPSSTSSAKRSPNAAASTSNGSPSPPGPKQPSPSFAPAPVTKQRVPRGRTPATPPHRSLRHRRRPRRTPGDIGRLAGLFDVNGRQLFLSCVGHGEPTVILVGGLSSDWTEVQQSVSRHPPVCSYDKPNVLGSRSEHARPPRHTAGMADELSTCSSRRRARPLPDRRPLQRRHGRPELFAATHRDRIAGIVLVDSAHEDQDRRAADLARSQLAPEEADALIAGMTATLPRLVDPEQFDHTVGCDQLRAAGRPPLCPPSRWPCSSTGCRSKTSRPNWPNSTNPSGDGYRRDVAALVPGAHYHIVADTTHDIHGDRPDIVANTIIDIFAAGRDQQD